MDWAHEPPASELDAKVHDTYQHLTSLMAEYLREHPDDAYLQFHASGEVTLNQVRMIRWYLRHLPVRGRVLDWGCRHAPDSIVLRQVRGDAYELHGCDFPDCRRYQRFHEDGGLQFTALTDIVSLPYPDQSFDVVIGAGTLEHAAQDYESLKELYRVLAPGGVLIFTHLPHRHSRIEYVNRVVRKEGYHKRLYDLDETDRLLKRAGLLPTQLGYQERLLRDECHARILHGRPRRFRSWLLRGKWTLGRFLRGPGAYTALYGVARKQHMM
jgi:SAM-dependent methyltransferase